jgi:acyl carrier protein
MPRDEDSPTATAGKDEEMLFLVGTVVGRLAPEPVEFAAADQRLIEDLGYHSLAVVELTFLLEELFSLGQIEPDEAASIQSVADVARYISAAVSQDQPTPTREHVAELLEDFVAPVD